MQAPGDNKNHDGSPPAVGTSLEPLWTLLTRLGAQKDSAPGISRLEHALRCATLATEEDAPEALVLAALLHDIGHLLEPDFRSDNKPRADRHHILGASFLALWFGPEVTEPVRLHVAARRYFYAVERGYARRLHVGAAVGSVSQGTEMSVEECRDFLDQPYAQAALQLRRWDDRANHLAIDCLPLARLREMAEHYLATNGGGR